MKMRLPLVAVIAALLTAGLAAGEVVRIEIDAAARAERPVPRRLYGKFTEHLWWNVYNGFWAQVLKNPGFDPWELMGKSRGRVGEWIRRMGFPASFPHLPTTGAEEKAAVPWWFAYGGANVSTVLEGGGNHCLRIAAGSGAGIEQPIFLPLHREQNYEIKLTAKGDARFRVTVRSARGEIGVAEAPHPGREWNRRSLTMKVNAAGLERGTPLLLRIELSEPGSVTLDRLVLFPADNIEGFDPDIVRMLRASRLPLLRFPGGNFVSGYHWEDGVGPVESRPARTNPAWGGLEPNHVGTDEYMAFCRLVGCEPMICVNAGNGSAAEAAHWVEYCNGSTKTKYGALRAKNGHPEPYNVKLWEIGNELYGKWQIGHCTPEEYAERYAEFHAVMSAVDPSLEFLAIGQNEKWVAPLLASHPEMVNILAVHELPGGGTPADAPPQAVFEELMAYPAAMRVKFLGLAARMKEAGLVPKIGLTEAQIFTNKRSLPTNDSLAEALYLAGIIHMAIREGGMVRLITHSALVNHGGGLRKQREIVYATPVHYASLLYGTQSGIYPVEVKTTAPEYESPGRYLAGTRGRKTPLLDPIALVNEAGDELTLIVINRSPDAPLTTAISVAGFAAQRRVRTRTLAAAGFMERNSLEQPERVRLAEGFTEQRQGKLTYEFRPHSLVALVFRKTH